MLLSELYGKIGQILKEKGDMPVVKPNPFKTTWQPIFLEKESNDFRTEIINIYKQKVDGKYFDETVINTHKYFVVT